MLHHNDMLWAITWDKFELFDGLPLTQRVSCETHGLSKEKQGEKCENAKHPMEKPETCLYDI